MDEEEVVVDEEVGRGVQLQDTRERFVKALDLPSMSKSTAVGSRGIGKAAEAGAEAGGAITRVHRGRETIRLGTDRGTAASFMCVWTEAREATRKLLPRSPRMQACWEFILSQLSLVFGRALLRPLATH